MHCDDMIEHSLHKVLIHMGHVLRCESQNLRMSEVMKQSTGGTLIITIYHMMKHEETRARESSREHYIKRELLPMLLWLSAKLIITLFLREHAACHLREMVLKMPKLI